MTVTDPDVPDPLHDPRTTQADPGALAQGADLASAGDDPAPAGEDEPGDDTGTTAGRTVADDAGGGDALGGERPDAP
jgi:hypothetical protein